ncbi:MAG: hypothetical protein R6U54_01645, partial [Candidatus Omnitrophota bacterium]
YSGNIKKLLLFTVYLLLITSVTTRILNPYSFVGLFRPNSRFIDNIKELENYNQPDSWFPPAIQWNNTKPLIFPAKNIFFWGLGVPMGILILIAIARVILSAAKDPKGILRPKFRPQNDDLMIVIWILLLFIYQGVQFSKTMRYFLPIYPFMALVGGNFLSKYFPKIPRVPKFLVLGSLFIYPLMFMAIYSRPHTRVKASQWIYENIPPGSTISCEHWDDCLPLSIGKKNPSLYNQETLPLYDKDTDEKWKKINNQLEKIDFIIISSSRLYGSIPMLPERYSKSIDFYKRLFSDELITISNKGRFKKVAEITSYPSLFGIELNDDASEEAFTVYDHPKVIIFEKTINEK